MAYIYSLSDPRTTQVRYIGKTDNLVRRLKMHLSDKSHCHRAHWIQQLLAQGYEPVMAVIEECPDESWEEREIYWIAHYRAIGAPLTNGTNGGDQPPNCTGVHLLKSPRGLANIRAALVARNKSPEMREVARRKGKNLGNQHTPETKEKISKSLMGHPASENQRQAAIRSNQARTYDPNIMRQRARKLWDDPNYAEIQRERLAKQAKRAAWIHWHPNEPFPEDHE